ncbi:MAG: zf-TFIIB domain-containing protein [Planctomycetes bacterium]|nr:zf-TFIIB domain-containing protein [Planctomycetota bacterium]
MAQRKVKCPNCGAETAATGACGFCGATAFVDGVAGRLLPSDLKCPRCKGGPGLRGLEHDGIRADLCMGCHGVWFGPGQLEEAIRTASKRAPAPGEGERGPDHGGVEPVRYARCPRCDGGMSRVPLARKPLVIVDRCPAHGDWCDGGELGQLKVVARTRGMAAIGAPEPTRAMDPKAGRAKPAPLDLPLGPAPRRGGLLPTMVRRRPDLFDLLWSLFS